MARLPSRERQQLIQDARRGLGAGATAVASILFSAGAVSAQLSAVTFNNAGGVSFGLSNGVITGGAPAGAGFNVSASGSSGILSGLSFSNGSGVTFGMSGSTVTASVQTNYQSAGPYLTTAQPVGAYLTTAALSQDSSKYAGTNGAITGGSITVNTSGVSINLPAYLTTAQPVGAYLTTAALSGDTTKYAGVGETVSTTNGTALLMTVDTLGVKISHPNWLTTAQPVGAYLTTAALSQDSSKYAGTGATIGTTNGTDILATQNTAGLSLRHPAFLTTAQPVGAYLTTAALSQDSSKYAGTGITIGTTAGTDLVGTLGTNGISLRHPNWLTVAGGGGGAGTGVTISTTAGTDIVATLSTNGLSLRHPAWLTTAQPVGAYLTTAGLSQDSSKYAGTGVTIGTTAGTDVVATLSTNGLSFRQINALTTAALSNHSHGNPTLALTNLSGTTASNSAGLTLSLAAAAPGGGGTINQYEAFEAQSNMGAVSNGTWSFYPIEIPAQLEASRIAFLLSASTASAVTAGLQVSIGLYTLNGSTLSLASSNSMSSTWTSGSNSSTNWGGLIGPRLVTCPTPGTITPAQWFLGVAFRTSNSGTFTVFGMSTVAFSGHIGQDTNASRMMAPGFGYYSVSSAAAPVSVPLSQMVGSGNGQRFPWFNFYQHTA